MKSILFLDDERFPKDVTWVNYPEDTDFVIARTFKEFQLYWEKEDFDAISFDHDLQNFHNGIEYTGMDCVKWLVDQILIHRYKVPEVYFHTQNPIGKGNMESYWNNFVKFYGGETE